MAPQTLRLKRALLPDGVHDDVVVEVADGRFTTVVAAASAPALADAATDVPGLTIPGLANCHSHAFHRALRGRTQRERGSFWTWRDQMYSVAATLDPDSYLRLATAAYREMVATGITAVGEFHYLHHRPDGRPYADPNAIGDALVEAARIAGIRLTLLDTCYLSSGFGAPATGVQIRYDDGSAAAWSERFAALTERYDAAADVRIGAAIHSVRAVPRADLPTVVATAAGRPLHVHLSEQVAENAGCLEAYGCTPTELLAEAGALTDRTSLVHATHLTDGDIAKIGAAAAYACFCPTTERDLGDGIGPSRELDAAGARLTLGSDSHAIVDPFEEMRAVELNQRLASQTRGHWSAAELFTAATSAGHLSLGFDDAGAIAVGQLADLVVLDDRSPTTAGTSSEPAGALETVVFAATAADVRRVMASGRWVFGAEAGWVEERAQIGLALADTISEVHQ